MYILRGGTRICTYATFITGNYGLPQRERKRTRRHLAVADRTTTPTARQAKLPAWLTDGQYWLTVSTNYDHFSVRADKHAQTTGGVVNSVNAVFSERMFNPKTQYTKFFVIINELTTVGDER